MHAPLTDHESGIDLESNLDMQLVLSLFSVCLYLYNKIWLCNIYHKDGLAHLERYII